MALPTCNVVCAMHDQEGAPVPGATFEFKLNRQEVYEGFVVPTRVVGTAGEDGTCTVALWPNQLGSAESAYNVAIRSPGGRTERVTATIPNVATVNLHEVSALPPYPGKPDAQAYLELAQGIVEDAQEAAAASASSASASAGSAGTASASASASAASAAASAGSAASAAGSAGAASASAATAAGHAAAASGSSTSASGFAGDSAASAGASAGSAATASGHAASAAASAILAQNTVNDLVSAGLGSHRNRLINGDFSQNARALTSVADDTYFLDRWYVLAETGNVTVAQITDAESGAPFGIRLTQPDASPKRMGFAQIIESKNIRQYASQAMHLAARLRMSAGSNIRYAVLEHTGTADVVTSDVVNNWGSASFTPSNFFIAGINVVSTGIIAPGAATWGEVGDWDALSAAVKNVIVFIWTESQVAQNGTLDCSRIQYEPGVVATAQDWRMNEDFHCLPYAEAGLAEVLAYQIATGYFSVRIPFKRAKRVVPACTASFAYVNANNGPVLFPAATVNDFRYGAQAIASGSVQVSGAWLATAEL